jgi:hypothetical protein
MNRLHNKTASGARDPYQTEIGSSVKALRDKLLAEGLKTEVPTAAPIKLRASETPLTKPKPDVLKPQLKKGTQPGYVILKEIRD